MIYAIAGLNILGILPIESLPSRASGSKDWVERSIQTEKTERHATQALALRERCHKSSIPVYPGWFYPVSAESNP